MSSRALLTSALALAYAYAFALAAACRPSGAGGDGTPDARESPQASAEPAPLSTAPPTTASATPLVAEGGPPPQPLRHDERLPAEGYGRESAGYTLSAALRPADVPAPPRAPEVNAAGLEAARRRTELRLAIDLTATRMRIVLSGAGFVLPSETEIRARADRYGHVVVWPGAATYRPLAPGAMRALLGERRFDVAPITKADVSARDELGKRIGIKTRKVEVSTRAAKATFEVGKLESLGEGGVLLCRWLLDLMNAPPQTAVCGLDELPLRAELRWVAHGALGFELTGVLRKTDMPQSSMMIPPPGASFAGSPMPVGGVEVLLTQPELAAFRTMPIDVPPPPPTTTTTPIAASTGAAAPVAPQPNGLWVTNATQQLKMVYLDGVPIAWAAPGARDVVAGLQRGRYVVQWRTFLGDAVEPPLTLVVPGATQVGGGDAGAR